MNAKRLVMCGLAIALCALASAPETMAAGTPAGTVISNQAYADYKDANGNAMTRVYSNTVTVTVSPVYAISIAPPTDSKAGAHNTTVMYLIQIFNNGNTPDPAGFTYTLQSGWTPTSVTFYWDANNNHTYEPGTDTLIGSGAGPWSTASFVPAGTAADDDFDVFMIVGVPGDAADTSTSVIRVTATSVGDGTKTAFGTYTTAVSTAVVTGQKTHTPTSPRPGDTVTYTIAMTNSGTSAADATTVTDPIPANMTYVPGTIKTGATLGSLATKTDSSGDGDGAFFSANTVTADVGTIAGGGAVFYVQFQATVNSGVASGSAITNQAGIQYTSGGNTYTVQTNGETLFIATLASVLLDADRTWFKNPSDQVVSPFTVTNYGNHPDTFNLTYTSSAGWTYAFWVDVDGNGIPGTDGDYLLTDANADGIIDTGSIAQGGALNILAVTTVPPGTPDHTTDATVITGRSTNNATIYDVQNITTTVTAPVLSLVKTVSPGGSQPPGTVLTYTVTLTNSGTGTATNVVVTDIRPQYTTYQAGTLMTGATAGSLTGRSDAADSDGAHYDAGTHAVLTDPFTLGAGGTFVLQFQVMID